MFEFTLTSTDHRARTGIFRTPHGELETPVFAPVGTAATVKALTPAQLTELGATLVLSNTYHLYLRPGDELVRELGGLHRFMGWDGPMLTDSGGFQVFSLSRHAQDRRRRRDLQEPYRRLACTASRPRSPSHIQENLGADIIMAFDECPPPLDRAYNEIALARTHAWAARCQQAKTRRRPGAVRHRAGRGVSRPARAVGALSHRPGLSRLRHRRAGGGRDQGRDARHAGCDRRRCCRPTSRAT